MRKSLLSILGLLAVVVIMSSCNKEKDVTVKIEWIDEANFELTENWKCALMEDAMGTPAKIRAAAAVETKTVTAGTTNEVVFSYDGDALTWSAVVYHDANNNNSIDEDEYNMYYAFGTEDDITVKPMY